MICKYSLCNLLLKSLKIYLSNICKHQNGVLQKKVRFARKTKSDKSCLMNFDDIGHEVAIVASNQVLCDEHSVNQEVGWVICIGPKVIVISSNYF